MGKAPIIYCRDQDSKSGGKITLEQYFDVV